VQRPDPSAASPSPGSPIPFQMASLFEAIAAVVPDRDALVCEGRRFRYDELDTRANRLADALASRGIRRGDHVGTYLYNGEPYVTTMLACFKLGAVPVNINFRYVEDELRYLFDNADLVGLVFEEEFAGRVEAVRSACPGLRVLLVSSPGGGGAGVPGAEDYEAALAAGSPERSFPGRSADDLFIIYTGGTTGMPKGVMWRHEDLFFAGMGGGDPTGGRPVSSAEELAERARSSPAQLTMFPAAPLIHGAAQLATFIAFFSANKLVLQRHFDAEQIVRLVEEEKVNTLSIVGDAMARPIADALHRNASGGGRDVSSLLAIGSAGAIFSEPVKRRIRELLPQIGIVDSYGSTETGFQGTGAGGESRSFGQGLAFRMNDRTVVLDDELRPVEPGSGRRGRVALRGCVPVGYYKDPHKTARTFVEVDGERMALTGDVAEVEADGTVRLFGRGSVCINTGGEKVFVEEVENALKSHASVYDAVVVGVDDERWGQRVVALVSLDRDAPPADEEALRAHAREHVAGYKVPKEIYVQDEIFRGPNGKADYKLARQIASRCCEARGGG